jgi:thiol-disulfide isomerase/thioredoxin
MKNLLKTFGLLAILSVVFSGFTACSNTANTQKSQIDENAPASNTVETTAANSASVNDKSSDKSSEYPPLPEKAAQAEFKTLEGETTKIENLKGSVLLLNLWATWCGPCRKEMPELVAMENEFKEKGFKVIGFNVDDETPEQIKPFAEDMKLNYQLAWADENLYRELLKVSKFNGIPQSFLVDRQGHLRGVFLGGSPKVVKEMRENVEKVVNEM